MTPVLNVEKLTRLDSSTAVIDRTTQCNDEDENRQYDEKNGYATQTLLHRR